MDLESSIHSVRDHLVIDMDARKWCCLPYPEHPKGCPNYGLHASCPPNVVTVDKFINLNSSATRFIIVRFDLASHVEKMKRLHPKLSDRQARCLLYWQPKVRTLQKRLIGLWLDDYAKPENYVFTLIPEAMGVNVFATLDKLSVTYERQPVNYVTKVALVGEKK